MQPAIKWAVQTFPDLKQPFMSALQVEACPFQNGIHQSFLSRPGATFGSDCPASYPPARDITVPALSGVVGYWAIAE